MQLFKELTNTRRATESDFRTKQNQLRLNVEYYQYHHYQKVWELMVTDEDTHRADLKSRIILGGIQVPRTPILWNQNPVLVAKAKETINHLELSNNT